METDKILLTSEQIQFLHELKKLMFYNATWDYIIDMINRILCENCYYEIDRSILDNLRTTYIDRLKNKIL